MSKQTKLFLEENLIDNNRIIINNHAWICIEENIRVIFLSGIPIYNYNEEDKVGKNLVMVLLANVGLALTNEIAHAFDVHRCTIYRLQKKIEDGGISNLIEKKSGPKRGKKIKAEKEKLLKKLKSQGMSNRKIASKLGLSETGIRKALKRIGYKPEEKKSGQLSLVEADSAGMFLQEEKGEKRTLESAGSQEFCEIVKEEIKIDKEKEDKNAQEPEEGSRDISISGEIGRAHV